MSALSSVSSFLGIRHEIHNDFRFNVIIDDIDELFTFTEFALPTLTVEVDQWKEGGQNSYVHQLPKRVTMGTVKLKHGITSELGLLGWYIDVMNGDWVNAKRQVSVELIAPMGYAAIIWNFRDAFPIKWTGPLMKSDATGIMIDELEIAYHGFEIQSGSEINAAENMARMADFTARQQYGF